MKNYINLTEKEVPTFSNEKLKELIRKNNCVIKVHSYNCIHCTNLKPEWDKFVSKIGNNPNVYVIDIESNYFQQMDEPTIKDEVIGFPTIMYVSNNKTPSIYDGERESNKMYDWSMSKIKNSLNLYRSKLNKNTKSTKRKTLKNKSSNKKLKKVKKSNKQKKTRKHKKTKK